MNLKIKSKFKDRVVGFNNSALPLGEREDLDVLADIAVRSGDPSLLEVFEKVPTTKDLEAHKSAKFLEETKNTPSNDEQSNNTGEPSGE